MNLQNEAINILLRTIGEQPLDTSLSYEDVYEAQEAYDTIQQVTKEVLSEGWVFNSESNRPYLPDSDGYIVIPENVLRIDPSSTSEDFVRKDGKLYNKTDKSYLFTSSVNCEVIFDMDFDDIPLTFQTYIVAKAARIMFMRVVADTNMYSILKQEEKEAYLNCLVYDEEAGDYNIFNDQSVSRALTRNSNPVGLRG